MDGSSERAISCAALCRKYGQGAQGPFESVAENKEATWEPADGAISASHRKVRGEIFDPWRLHRSMKTRPVGVTKIFRNNQIDWMTDRLVSRVSKQSLSTNVPTTDDPLGVSLDHGSAVHVSSSCACHLGNC
jgi:hypothetical protein